ncbi:MAG: hypothetical protein ACXAC2_22780, partial [Candidatus Kariarchaeaceae archaeon]
MIKKILISFLLMMLLLSSQTQAQDIPVVSTFSYSDDLKAGDTFEWEVTSTYAVQDPSFKHGSNIKVEVLQDLAGKEFTGDLSSTELTDYFSVDFGISSYVSGDDVLHTVIFPTSV